MSTRGAIGFTKNGKHKVTYNHSDSYPTWLGNEVLDYLRGKSMEQLNADFQKITLVSSRDTATEEHIDRCLHLANTGVGNQKLTDYYCLLRDAQGQLDLYAEVGLMTDDASFLFDSLFCEWAYLVNLDNATLEVYKGFQKSRPLGRYSDYEPEKKENMNTYYAVSLVAVYSLRDLPKEFTKDTEALFVALDKRGQVLNNHLYGLSGINGGKMEKIRPEVDSTLFDIQVLFNKLRQSKQFYTVVFRKKDNSIRVLNGRFGVTNCLRGGENKNPEVKVGEQVTVWCRKNKAYRTVTMRKIIEVRTGGKVYKNTEYSP